MSSKSKKQWLPAEARGNGKGSGRRVERADGRIGAVDEEAPRAVGGTKKGKAKAKEREEGSEGIEEEEGSDGEGESDEEPRRREKAPEYLDEDAPLGDQIGDPDAEDMSYKELKLQYARLRAQTASCERSSTPATARQLKPAGRENTVTGTDNRAQTEVPQPAKKKRRVADSDDENRVRKNPMIKFTPKG